MPKVELHHCIKNDEYWNSINDVEEKFAHFGAWRQHKVTYTLLTRLQVPRVAAG